MSAALCGALAVGAAGCDNGSPDAGGDELVIRAATTATVDALDPAAATGTGAHAVLGNVYQTLLTIGPNETVPTPDAAECQYDTPTTYTCTVKPKQTFHNGHRLTASDVKFTFDRLRRLRRTTLIRALASVEARDEQTVVFRLRAPDATFAYALTTPVASLVDEEVFPAAAVLPDARVVGSGPYRIAAYDGRHAILERFAEYRGVRRARNTKVELALGQDSAALVKAVKVGSADVVSGELTAPDLRTLQATETARVTTLDAGLLGYWAFHLKAPSGRQLAVRRAIARLIDRKAIADKAYAGQVTPRYSLLPAGFDGHQETFRDSYGTEPNRTAAAALLRAAGVRAPVPLTVGWTPQRYGPQARLEAEELRRQLTVSGLFTVTLVSAEWPAYDEAARSGGYDLFQRVRTADHADGDTFVSPVLRPGGAVDNGYGSAAVDRLVAAEIAAQGRSAHDAALIDLQRQVTEDVAMLPVWQGQVPAVSAVGVDGVQRAVGPLFDVHYAYLSK